MQKRRLKVQHWYESNAIYWCGFCNTEIAHVGFDPVRLVVEPARPAASGESSPWVLWAHVHCLRDALDRDFAREIPSDWYSAD
jgi:hypothetical protein